MSDPSQPPTTTDGTKGLLAGALGAGLLASACCTLPLLLVAAGVGGAWLANLRALEAWRPLFVAGALVALGLAYRRLKAKEAACETGSCPVEDVRRTRRLVAWTGLVTILLILSPYFIGLLLR